MDQQAYSDMLAQQQAQHNAIMAQQAADQAAQQAASAAQQRYFEDQNRNNSQMMAYSYQMEMERQRREGEPFGYSSSGSSTGGAGCLAVGFVLLMVIGYIMVAGRPHGNQSSSTSTESAGSSTGSDAGNAPNNQLLTDTDVRTLSREQLQAHINLIYSVAAGRTGHRHVRWSDFTFTERENIKKLVSARAKLASGNAVR